MNLTRQELLTIDVYVTRFVMDYPTYDFQVPENALITLQQTPPWSSDDSLALAIVDYLISEGFTAQIVGKTEGWEVTLLYGKATVVEHKAFAPKLSQAICLAALFSVGIRAV